LKINLYNLIKVYVKIGLFFTHKQIKVYGKENIPKNGPILFIGNHRNALIDAILIPTTTNRNIHFLTRASAFKNKTIESFLRALNMIPVYRLRDGRETIKKNNEVFEQCFEILKNEKAIEIFAEGEHHQLRKVIPLKKGFARIILGTLQKHPNLNIQIVPVGINYDAHLKFPSSTSIYYGNPIIANHFFDIKNPDFKFKSILNEVHKALIQLTVHIEDPTNYIQLVSKLDAAKVDYLNPMKVNELLKNIDNLPKSEKKIKINWLSPIHFIAKINSFFPLLIWKFLKSKIKDPIFTNTYRFALILTVFPLFYLIQASVIFYFSNFKYALIYLISCILLGIISTKTMSVTQ
jgi:1-acyl-sn-glycerol-3-phosphate acyltransferase